MTMIKENKSHEEICFDATSLLLSCKLSDLKKEFPASRKFQEKAYREAQSEIRKITREIEDMMEGRRTKGYISS